MQDSPKRDKPAPDGSYPYLGGRVAPFVGEGRRGTTLEQDTVQKNLEKVRELGGTVDGRTIRIPAVHAGLACVDWLARNGYQVIWV